MPARARARRCATDLTGQASAAFTQHYLGSVLATIGPLTGESVVLGLPSLEVTLLLVTFLVSIATFSGNRTNILKGTIHRLLFPVYIMLIFRP
jgi:Ca2+/H+ antiporter